ncbi:uncharacterized protein F5147DRAFT_657161 [Suillus discolor]|uniref:Uncharacterized protein n=1 Tax=Suillus discolor TaxID=1912936 RepID=A0A9P7JP15_9AGAM|nr:uncharacterized protein F5147DRAFT_657161 [Suillus discolor]KAG2094395.1 hypothetical protein F5147DRAFT_657161 [Suillus discolor]
MTSTSTSVILPKFNLPSALPSCPDQSPMDRLLDKALEGNILWEETDLPATAPSLMDRIIPTSSLDISTIEKITYTTGAHILVSQKWKLERNVLWGTKKVKKQKVLDEVVRTGDEDSSSASTSTDASDQSCDALEFNPTRPKRKLPSKVRTRAQRWARLFNAIHNVMRMSYKETYPHRSPMYPFEPADIKRPHRQWSPEFCNVPIPDATNNQKPDIVLIDRDVQPKSWAHVLTCVEITESDLGANHNIPLFKGVVTKGYLMM